MSTRPVYLEADDGTYHVFRHWRKDAISQWRRVHPGSRHVGHREVCHGYQQRPRCIIVLHDRR
jgi:hypothetical protein